MINYIRFIYIILRIKPDILHINPSLDKKSIYRDNLYVILAKLFHRSIKIVMHIRGWNTSIEDEFILNNIFNLILKNILHKSNRIIVLSSKFREAIVRNFNVSASYIFVIPTAANLSEFFKEGNTKKDDSEIRLLYLSRLIKDKGIYEIANSINPIIEHNPDKNISFTFAGDGDERAGLKNYIDRLGVDNYAKFLGYVRGDKKIKTLISSHIFLFPSYHSEGCPVAVLEAMAAGLPIISTNVGALGDIIKDGINGIVIKDQSSEAIVRAVDLLIKDENLRNKMACNNRQKVKNEFDAKIIFNKIEGIYHKLLFNN
jgi:glycosyltransferase involved in cell wall biosynthesis